MVGMLLNWKLCLVVMAFVPVNVIAGFVNIKARSSKTGGKFSEEEGGRIATETVENIKTVISLGREDYFYDLFTTTFNKKFKKTLIMGHIRGVFYGISSSVLFFIQATAFSYGFYLVMNEGLKISKLYKYVIFLFIYNTLR